MVTFVTPSIGRDTVGRTVRSLLAMQNPAWKSLVGFDAVDQALIDHLDLPQDDRIAYINLPAKAGGGRNFGGGVRSQLISQIDSPWIAFVDDDDTLRPDYIDRLIDETQRHPAARCVVFRMSYDPSDTNVLPPLSIGRPIKNKVGISFAVAHSLLANLNLNFENGPTEDFDLLNRIHAAGETIVFSPHIVYNVRF